MKTQFKDQSETEQRVASLEQMLEMTTSYMSEIESDLKEKKQKLEAYNEQFNQSLSFASIIQNTIQPDEGQITGVFKNAFLINKPRDVIGGDLVWMRKTDRFIYLASMDCTGHGVPGALLSMVANFSMNAVVEKKDYSDPKEFILDFNGQFCNYFQHHNTGSEDLMHGLDIGMVIYDRKKKTLSFNGTHQSLVFTTGEEVKSIRGNSAYIGNSNLGLEPSTSVPVRVDSRYFLFSDGIVDQFGGPKNKKFLARRFRQLLFDTRSMEIQKQKREIVRTLLEWKGDEEQTDDVLLIGFEID